MADYTAYLNGEWVSLADVKIESTDRGFYVGDVVFDVERTFNGKSFRMREHIDRLYRSLKYARIDPSLSPEEMVEISEEAIRRNEHVRADVGDFNITQFVTRGRGRRAWNAGPPTACVKVAPIDYSYFANAYGDGMHAVIPRTRSYSPQSLDPKVKHYSRMNFSLAELEANDVDPGAWPILADTQGNLTEGSGYNMFIVTDGVLRTPEDNALLQGVTRQMVCDLAKQLSIPVVEESLQPYDIYTSDEAFFASTSFCILPVTHVDRRVVGDGKPGPVTQQLLAAWSEAVGLDVVDQAVRFNRG